MAYNNGIDGKALLDEISKVIDAAANQYHEAGEDAGEEYVKGVVDGIKKHSKDAKSEIAKLYEDFNKTTNNFKSRKSVTQAEWTRVLGLSKELMKSERYANSVKEKLSDISVTFKNGVNVSGLEKVLEEWSKVGGLVESVSWSETSKNYKKRTGARKTKAETPDVNVDPVPVVKAEVKKQEAIVDTTKKINEQTDALRKQEAAVNDVASAQEKYNQRMSEIKDKYSGDINKQKQLISNQEAWIKYLNGSLDESKFKTTGKKAATDQLRSLTHYMTNSRLNNYKNDPGQYPKEMAEVAWMRGYQEAERQGVADSVLKRFDTDARYNFDKNLKTLQDEYDYRKKAMDDAYAKLQRLYLERDKEGFAAFADHLMPDGPQSDEESRILSEITEQVANKTLDYGDAKANLEKSIMTLRNMASSEAKVNLKNLVDDLKKTYDAETFDKVFGADFNMFTGFDKIDDTGAKELYDMLIESNKEYHASLVKTTDAQKEFSKQVKDNNLLYHAGDLSNPSKTQKTYPLGHVRPSKSGGIFNGFTGLYTTEDVDGFWGNEWSGAPISTIDASQYKLFDASSDAVASAVKVFFDNLNGTIYGYIDDFTTGAAKRLTDVKTIDELWTDFNEIFKSANISFETFETFVKRAQGLVSGKNFMEIDGLPDIDEGIVKTGEDNVLQGASKEVFNSDSFQTQLLKMLGFEGIDLRNTKYNGTYTGGTVLFDVKPESIKTTNEKWSDVMARNGYSIDEAHLAREEKRRQLAFDTAKAYSQQADAAKEVESSQKPSTQDRLANVEAELEAKMRQFKEVATEGRAVTEELYGKALKYNVPETAIPAVHFSTDDLLKAYEERNGRAFDYKEQIKDHKQFVDTNDVAKAFYQMSMFPEKYGGNPLDYFESKKYFGDQRISSEFLIPLGNGKSITFGKSSGWLMRTNHADSVASGVDENGVVIDKESFPLPDQSFDKISKETKRILGMSYDEVAKLPIISQAATDYEAQYKQDNAMWKALHMLGDKTPEFVDETKPLADKYSDLGKRAEAIKADISRLKQEKKALEQEINLEAQFSQEEAKEISKKATVQTKVEKHEPTVFEDENGQLALFDGISSSAQRATEDAKELENELKSIENLEGQVSIDDYVADKAKLEAESKQAEQFETDNGQLAFLQGVSDAAQKAESGIEEVTDAARKLNDIPGQLDFIDESYLNQNALNGQKNVLETPNDELKETFDIIQQGESVTGKFVTTANTVHEALRKMRDALPEDKQACGKYIDNILAQDEMIGAFKSISGSMGNRSELYKMENLGDGRLEVTFSGIRDEAQVASIALQKLEEHVNNLGDEFKNSEQCKTNFDSLVQGIKSGSITAAQAMEKMSDAYEEWNSSLVGANTDEAKESLSIAVDRTNPLVNNAFKGMNIKDWIAKNVQPDARNQLEEELYKLAQTLVDDNGDAYNAQLSNIADFIVANYKSREQKEANAYEELFKSLVVVYDDKDVAAMGPQLFEKAKSILGRRLQKRNDKNKHFDDIATLVQTIGENYGGLIEDPDGAYSYYDKLDQVLDGYADWKKDASRKTVDRTLSDSDKPGIIDSFNENMLPQMIQNMAESASKLEEEQLAFDGVAKSADKAAKAKEKFDKANQKVQQGADESSDSLDDEAESLENVNRAAANLPDVSAYDSTTIRYDTNGNPYSVSGTSRQEMIDGTHVRSTDNYQFDAENNRWDYMGTVQSAERTREMVQALEEYYRILNQIQKLRLDPSSAIHTEEINKLETDDLARAYQRVCDLGIQVNDIEGQINLSVSQRRALLDVELRARQEMYDVIAKMEDKQATAATKPFQKTVADEIKKAANIDTNVRLLGDEGASDRLQAQIADYRRLVDELVDMRLQLARNSDLTNNVDFSNRFADTAKRAENARVAIEGVFKESQKLQKLGTPFKTGDKDVSNVQNLKSEMIEFANSALDGEVKINGFNKEGNLMYATLTKAGGAVENITVALNSATGHLQAFSAGTSKATNEWEDFKAKAVDGAKNIIGMYVGFQEGVQALRTGVNYVKEIDLAMTELKKVTDETDASYKQFLEDAGSTSAIIGSTIKDFTEATATFARLGYSMEESSSMAETAIIYKNVADGLDTVEESSESIISTMMAFGIEANDTMSIIDRFNAVGKLYADYKVA